MSNCQEFLKLESRNYIWNSDFLRLMVQRLCLDNCQDILEVGCGMGHWSEQLVKNLSAHANFTFCDVDPSWIQAIEQKFSTYENSKMYKFCPANATNLIFDDGTFDLYTCQAVYLHLANINQAICEAKRVLKPKGKIILVEPENFKNYFMYDNLIKDRQVDDINNIAAFWQYVDRGKISQGQGNNSPCSSIVFTLVKNDFTNLQVFQNDKVKAIYPPYETNECRIFIDELNNYHNKIQDKNQIAILNQQFILGGGLRDKFEIMLNSVIADINRCLSAIANKTYVCINGLNLNLIYAQKE